MSDRAGDKTKQPPECTIDENNKCPNMRCTSETMNGERYRCEVCGESYYLDYEEMR